MHVLIQAASRTKIRMMLDMMGALHTMFSNVIKDLEVSGIQSGVTVRISQVYTKDSLPPVSQDHNPAKSNIARLPHLEGLEMPQITSEIGLFIGNGVPAAYTPLEVRTGSSSSPHVTRTAIGWEHGT